MTDSLKAAVLRGAARIVSIFSKKGTVWGYRRTELLEENLKAVLKRTPTEHEINEVFEFHSLYHIYLLVYPLMKRYIRVIPDRPELFEEFADEAREKGAICVSAHLGIPELATTLLDDVEVFALVEKMSSKLKRTFFNLTRRNIGVRTEEGFKNFVRQMENPKGKIFVILADRPIPNSKPVTMFGERFFISDLPFRLSKRFGLGVFGIMCRMDFMNRFRLSVQRLRGFDEMLMFLERMIAENFTQWNPFFKRDRVDLKQG